MKRAIDRRQFGIGSAAAAALAASGRAAAQNGPLKIRIGWVVVPASLAPLVLEKKELLTHFGRSYVAEATRFEGTPPVITALAAGESHLLAKIASALQESARSFAATGLKPTGITPSSRRRSRPCAPCWPRRKPI